MLLSNQKRLKIQEIIKRISLDKEVSLKERIYVEKYAKHNSTISLWLKKQIALEGMEQKQRE